MTYAGAWFLVMIGGSQFIGPLSEQSCNSAAPFLQSEGIVCKRAVGLMTCAVPGAPHMGTISVCPMFDFPQVMVKP